MSDGSQIMRHRQGVDKVSGVGLYQPAGVGVCEDETLVFPSTAASAAVVCSRQQTVDFPTVTVHEGPHSALAAPVAKTSCRRLPAGGCHDGVVDVGASFPCGAGGFEDPLVVFREDLDEGSDVGPPV